MRPSDAANSYLGGRYPLGLDSARDAILQTPKAQPSTRFALLVFLHGEGEMAEQVFDHFGTLPEERGVAILAPTARDKTWDAISGGDYGPDIVFLNRALKIVFEMLPVDPGALFFGGFADGASYAVSLELINGDLFRGAIAFSPAKIITGQKNGRPNFFLAHGKQDAVTPIKKAREDVYGRLAGNDYGLTMKEFDGGHEMPPEMVLEGMNWLESHRLQRY